MSRPYVVVCRGLAGRDYTREGVPPPLGQFLKSYAPEARGGAGVVEWTADRGQAMTFPTERAAWALWAKVPLNCPLRADGRPNRPLTAYTVEVTNGPLLDWPVPSP